MFLCECLKFLGKLLCRTPPSVHLSHDVFFSFLQIREVGSLNSVYLVNQWYVRKKNSRVFSVLRSYGNQVETSLSSCGRTCTDLDIPIAGEVEEKEQLKSLLKRRKFSFYLMVDHKTFTYLKNKK